MDNKKTCTCLSTTKHYGDRSVNKDNDIEYSSKIDAQSKLDPNDIQLLTNVFEKIFQNLNNKKYQNLNRTRVCKTFVKPELSMNVLHHAGFYKSNDGRRLLYDMNKLDHMKKLHANLHSLSTDNEKEEDNVSNTANKCILSTSHLYFDIFDTLHFYIYHM
eukprot:227907_1